MTQAIQSKPPVRIFFIVGPTAVGKTALSLELAERLGAHILSCDAYCIYRGMDIGTAKPTAAEQARASHHGVDLVEPSEPYSVEAYADYARSVVDQARAAGRPLVVAGGSGFYLKSFFAPVVDVIELSEEARAEIAALEEQGGFPAVRAALRERVGAGEVKLDWANPRRVHMALLRCLSSGKTLSQIQAEFAALPVPYADCAMEVCLLERPRDELAERIALRVDQMLAEGLVDEVSALRDRGIETNPTAEAAIGYRETLAYLRGEIGDLEALREAIVVHTRQLARRQRTWFRRQIPIDRTIPAAGARSEDAFPGAFSV